jgi:hypothetical protein
MAMAQGILPLEQAAMVLAIKSLLVSIRSQPYHTTNISSWEWAGRLLFAEK